MKLSSLVNNETLLSSDHGTIKVCPGNTSVELTCVAHNVTELVWSRNNETIHQFHVQSDLLIPIINGPYTAYLDSNTRVDNKNRFTIVTSKLTVTVMTSNDHLITADQIECKAFRGATQVDNDSIIISFYPIGKLVNIICISIAVCH